MSYEKPTVLVVDDTPDNIQLIQQWLEGDYELLAATNGEKALEVAASQAPDAVLLDVMMPGMDGFTVCQRLVENPKTANIPVIFQTALDSPENILHGLELGAYFYLTKPIEVAKLKAVVSTATEHFIAYKRLGEEHTKILKSLALIDEGRFRFRALDEVHNLALLVANACPSPEKVFLGLTELMINAVEHGNLGITYAEKSTLNQEMRWRVEVERRLELAEYRHKYAQLHVKRHKDALHFTIEDQGKGFDWQSYLEIKPERAFDTHGRGIAMAKAMSFDHLEYKGQGNLVTASVLLQDSFPD